MITIKTPIKVSSKYQITKNKKHMINSTKTMMLIRNKRIWMKIKMQNNQIINLYKYTSPPPMMNNN